MALWSIATSQAVRYYELYPKDKWSLRVYIAAAWALNTLALAFTDHAIYVDTVKALSDYRVLLEYTIGDRMIPLLGMSVALSMHLFCLWRIWTFGRMSTATVLNPALFYGALSIIVLAITAEVSATLYHFAKQIHVPSTAVYERYLKPDLTVTLSCVAATDFVLTLSLVYMLLRHQSGALRATKNMISQLVTYSLTTGTLCLTLAIMSIVSRIAWPSAYYYNLFSMVMAPVYLNSLLAA
ncbi:hypothetical protein FISHEDRAFT_76689 [Fistulina hepatica ATCC 64428]|uniref:DUF6534 domain-containing protein n=1 Tax=Fistulina hepatica ATCC 64428 TaxID=1128425 RepID=A0A0D7A2W4_9AGAR|nr:hypothetical protein FISHEDRAFT_76689 [Fistulina hepatica ATCC 64428]